MLRTPLVLTLAILALTSNAPAQQDTTGLVPGRRIRVHQQDKQVVVGTFASLDTAGLRLVAAPIDTVLLARGSITAVDISTGTKSGAGKGALIGGAIGAAAGVAVGAIACTVASEHNCGGMIPAGGVAFGLVGAGVGALIGSGSHTDRWEPIAWPTLSLLPGGPDRGMVALGMHLRF